VIGNQSNMQHDVTENRFTLFGIMLYGGYRRGRDARPFHVLFYRLE
jgi:hypothetical protein